MLLCISVNSGSCRLTIYPLSLPINLKQEAEIEFGKPSRLVCENIRSAAHFWISICVRVFLLSRERDGERLKKSRAIGRERDVRVIGGGERYESDEKERRVEDVRIAHLDLSHPAFAATPAKVSQDKGPERRERKDLSDAACPPFGERGRQHAMRIESAGVGNVWPTCAVCERPSSLPLAGFVE